MHFELLESRLQFNGGSVDPTFGTNGTSAALYAKPLGGAANGWAVKTSTFTLDTGGRIYGLADMRQDVIHGGAKKLVIARFSRDGQLDLNFGESGYKLLDRDPAVDTNSTYTPHEFVDQNNRTFVIDGTLLWRLSPGGKADATFGNKGKIVIPVMTALTATSMAFDDNGLAYLGGSSAGKTGGRMTVIRLSENGAWDTSWAFQGAYKSPVNAIAGTASSTATATNLKFLPGGALSVVGTYQRNDFDQDANHNFGTNGVWMSRLSASGAVDTTYGVTGYAFQEYNDSDVATGQVEPLAVAADGSVIGFIRVSTDADGDAGSSGHNWRVGADGTTVVDHLQIAPDSFDSQYNIEEITDPIAIQADGKVLAHGPNGKVFRSNLDGTIDTSWGTNGLAAFPGMELAISPDGAVVSQASEVFTRLYRDDAPLGQFDGRYTNKARSTAIRFSVIWRDDDSVSQLSIDSNDVRVAGPFDGGQRTRSATLELVESLGGGRYRATYKITSPGGWSRADNGVYTVKLVGGQISDNGNHAAGAGTLGTFRVKI